MKKLLLIVGIMSGIHLGGGSFVTAKSQEQPQQIIVKVKGMSCAFCAYGTRKNVERLPFVDQTFGKNGILMDTTQGTITIWVKEGKKVDSSKLAKAIIKGGYEPMDAFLIREGKEKEILHFDSQK